jgi:hypothetical protein
MEVLGMTASLLRACKSGVLEKKRRGPRKLWRKAIRELEKGLLDFRNIAGYYDPILGIGVDEAQVVNCVSCPFRVHLD